jgi:hypothetical protein
MLGVIYAEEGKPVRALKVWRELLSETPDYEMARANLALLGSPREVARGQTGLRPFSAAAVKANRRRTELRRPLSENRTRPLW